MLTIVEPDVRSLVKRLPVLAFPVQIKLEKLDEPFGEILKECRKRKILVTRNGPGSWTFVPPPEKQSSTAIVICRGGCLVLLFVAVLFSSPFGKLWTLLESHLKEYGLFTNLLASAIFSAAAIAIGHRYIRRFFKAFLGLGEDRGDVV
jgi:hypothetical protein